MVVLNDMADPKENIFYARLKEFTIHMKHQLLDILQLSSHFCMGLIGKNVTIC